MISTKSEDVAKSEANTILSCFSKFVIVYASLYKNIIYFIDLHVNRKNSQ